MMWVTLAVVAGWVVSLVVGARALERARREHARREDLLVNQLLHAAGRTWTPPPADDWQPEPDEPAERLFSVPEQWSL